MYLRNCWYVAAWDHELDGGFLARTILDRPVVLFRGPDGAPHALEDRCCHRSMPLSEGRLLEETVQCGYHGLEFAFDGRCVRVPGQSTIPPGARVRAWPVVERWRWVWIWMGDPDAADPDLIPDYHWNDDPEWTSYGDVY
ncbi:MAG: Rieske 2Fe-2S domain-containing protein, partial [Defluviicoccus sp.]|nr:Rieske 2Fe-2S domain-containing protein [Defluviicoccus sp.]